MTTPDFAAAQERINTRHRDQVQAQTRLGSPNLQTSNTRNRLPFPLNSIGLQGLAVWNRVTGTEGTRPAFRVGQVDAELLDEELLELLEAQVGDGLKFFGVGRLLLRQKAKRHKKTGFFLIYIRDI